MQVDGGGDDRLGPVGSAGKVGGGGDAPALHFEEQAGLRALSFGGVAFRGVVINPQAVDVGQEADEIFPTASPAFADFFLGDVVSAAGHAAADALKVKFGTGQSAEPDLQAVSGAGGVLEQPGDGASAQGGFEAVVAVLADGLFEERLADLPSVRVRLSE